MANSLGIFITNPDSVQHVLGVTKAAKAKGIKVKLFFSWSGTKLTKDPAWAELVELGDDVMICADSYKKMGYDVSDVPQGLTPEKMATQAQHGDVIENYDRYMTL